MQDAGLGLRRVQVHAEVGLRRERFDHLDVGDGALHRVLIAVARGEGVPVDAEQARRALLAVALDERGVEIVLPAAHRLDQALLERFQVRLRRHLAGPGADAHQDAPERRGRQVDVELRGDAVERLGQDALEALAQLGVVAIARREDQAGHEARVRVLAHQQAQALAIAELQDRSRVAIEVLGSDLQQLVARIGLEDRGERLAAVARGQQPGALDHLAELSAQQRHLHRVLAVRRVRVQAEEARLADHFAFVVEALDADVVELPGPMHGGARVRLGEHQQLLHPRALARLGRQRGEARGNGRAALAQDPQAAAGNDAQHVFAIDGIELIAAAAQEREVVLQEPGEEGALLVVPVRRQPLGDLGHARLHRFPVLDRRAHVGQDSGDARLQLGELRRIGLALDLDVHERFEPTFGSLTGLRN